ncbi:MAG: hypothetical protein HGA86_03315, partial [Anaerolineaceae bacterium]|nr:hypothetical protein [Anaerolineaceae bacterium]
RKLIQLYRLSRELHFIKILPDSELSGKTIRDIGWQQKTDTCVVGILREGKLKLTPAPDEQVGHYDILLIQGRLTNQMMQEYRLKEEREAEVPELVDESTTLAEIVIAPHSTMIGKNLADLHFREKYLLTVLAIWRNGKSIQAGLPELPLMYGDTLLVHGSANQIHLLDNEPDLILLEEDPDAVLRPNKNYLALGITLITLTIAALGILPIAVVVLAGAVLMILTGCMSMNDAYRGIEWKAIFLIAGMWPLSTALATTGLAAGGINLVLKLIGEVPPLVIAAVLLFSSFLLTQIMSGQVASLVLAPLAMAASSLTGIDPRGLGMAVALGCSLAFATPFGHPVNIMVMNPGGYTMKDYARVGFPLTILVAITILVGLHFYWGI